MRLVKLGLISLVGLFLVIFLLSLLISINHACFESDNHRCTG